MSDNIEVLNGRPLFATRGVPAWHALGEVFDQDEKVTTSQMLVKAGLDGWNVRLVDAPVPSDDYEFVTPTYYVVRDTPDGSGHKDILATVGGRYEVYQNEELFAFADNLLDGGGQWETAGSIKSGRQVFGSMLIDRKIVIDASGAGDVIDPYLMVNTSHDGTLGVQGHVTPVRPVCSNTVRWAIKAASASVKFRHTMNVEKSIVESRKALNIAHAYIDAFEAEVKALFETSMNSAEFVTLATTLNPKPEGESKAALTRWENKIDLLGDIFNSSVDGAPQTNVNIAGTAWAGLNALIEHIDWYRTGRGENAFTSLAEAASGFSPVVNAEKDKIHNLVLTFAKDKNAKAFA